MLLVKAQPLITTNEDEVAIPSELEETIEEVMAIAKHKKNSELSISTALQPMTTQEKLKFREQLAIFESNADSIPSVFEAKYIFRMKRQERFRNPGLVYGVEDKQWQILGTAWLIRNFRAHGSAILGDMRGLGKKLQIISALGFMNEERASKGEFGPALPSIVVCSASSILEWESAIEWTMSVGICKLYTVDSESTTWIKATLTDPASEDIASTVYITTYEFLLARHGPKRQNISSCFSLAILDDVETLGDEKTQKWQNVARLKPRYWVVIAKPPVTDWYKNLPSILALIRPDTLWADLKVMKTVNPFESATKDSRSSLVATNHAIKKFLDLVSDAHQRLKMLKQVYEQVMLVRNYSTEENNATFMKEILQRNAYILHIQPRATERQKMAVILDTNRKYLLRTNSKGVCIINGSKLKKLVLSSTWQPLADLSWNSHKILVFRANGITLRNFIYVIYNELGASLGFDPHALDDVSLLQRLFEQATKLAVVCRAYYEEILLRNDTLVIWVEYAIEQLFMELVLRSIGADVGSLHTGLPSKEQKYLCEQFNRHNSFFRPNPNVLIATYRAAGVGVNLQSHHSIHFTRALHRRMEMQASGHLRCQCLSNFTCGDIQKLSLNWSWDDDKLRESLWKAYSDFYADDNLEEEKDLKLIWEGQLRDDAKSLKRKYGE